MIRYFIIFVLGIFTSQLLFGAKVISIKKKSAIVDVSDIEVQKGDLLFLYDGDGKKSGIFKVMKLNNGKALGPFKGKAEVGWRAEPKGASGVTTSKTDSQTPALNRIGKKMRWGVLFGYAMNSMNVVLKEDSTSKEYTAATRGTGFNVKGGLDYSFSNYPSLGIRGALGISNFNAAGSVPVYLCDNKNSKDCTTAIMYLEGDAIGQWKFLTLSSMTAWVGGGGAMLFPISKRSTVIVQDKIGLNSIAIFALGLNYFLKSGTYLTVMFDYQYFMPTEVITASVTNLTFGYFF